MTNDLLKQISSNTDWAHAGRHRQHVAKTSYRRSSRRAQLRRAKRIYISLSVGGVVLGVAAAFFIHFTILKVLIGAVAGLIGGLTLGLLFER